MRGISKIFVIFIFLHHFSYSENADTLKLPKLKLQTVYFNSEQFENLDSVNFVENTLENFQNYLNPGYLGNSGMAINDMRQQFLSNELGFN